MKNTILSSDDLRVQLQDEFNNANEIILLSAYLTEEAVDWLLNDLSKSSNVTLVGRFLPSDFACGASAIKAVSKALNNGCKVACLPDLHAKIYVIDRQKMFVGSANFTSNGLKLHGQGNLEASIEAEVSEQNLEFVDKIVSNAVSINHAILADMEKYVEKNKNVLKSEKTYTKWPSNILPRDLKIWVTNFPWLNLSEESREESAIKHDKYEFGDNQEMFFSSKAYNWLCSVLKEKESQEIYYGELSAKLHNDLIDDPKPYRKEVKMLLSNLLTYVEKYAGNEIEVDRPDHSQHIKLISNAC
jgi:HKD family nuclease